MYFSTYIRIIFGGILIFAAPDLRAAETATYTYDELGRLVISSNSGGPRSGRETVISLDPAGNRKSYASGLPAPPQTNAATFSISGAPAIDEGGTAVFTVTKTGTAFTAMTINFVTSNGSAVANQDYLPENASLTFLPSETVKYYGVITVSDQVAEPSEQFTASLSAPSAGGSLGTALAGATINASAAAPPPNQPPVANPDPPTLQVVCGNDGLRNVVSNDTDPENDLPLTLVSLAGPGASYSAIENASTIKFSAPYARNALSYVTYTIRDARGATATGTLSLQAIGTAAQCNGTQQVQTTKEGE